MSTTIHIVCLDAPGPPDYGGAIDMYYKIQALAEIGRKSILHYFAYNPDRNAKGLEKYCESIHTYERKSLLASLPISNPHIVQSRINQDLIGRLNKNNFPILLEGLHCAGIIPFIRNHQRIVLRMHNEESAYYRHLANTESSFIKRQYFIQESKLLSKFQQSLPKDVKLACLSESDVTIFQTDFRFSQTHFIPCFLPWQKLENKMGKGTYCLYHGNMSVSENEEAAAWLIEEVFSKLRVPLCIAGKGISQRLEKLAAPFSNVTLVHQPTIQHIQELVNEAHIHVLPSMNKTGVKLKLLNVLFNGRFCITNYNGVAGSRINDGLTIAEDPIEWISHIEAFMKMDFTANEMEERKGLLSVYNNQKNAIRLSELW